MDVVLPKPSLERATLGPQALAALTDEALFDTCKVRIAFTSREGGVSHGAFSSLNTGANTNDDADAVLRNRKIVAAALGATPDQLVVPKQVHGSRIVVVRTAADCARAREEALAGADAIVALSAGIAPLLNGADCPLVIIVAPNGCVALAHAGWRGAIAGIAGATVRILARTAGDAAQFNAYISPHIGPECFEVSEDIADRFADAFSHDVVTSPRHVSLARAIKHDLIAAGMQSQRIIDAGICTKCNSERYFSYRATNGICGRHCAVAYKAPCLTETPVAKSAGSAPDA